MTNMQVFFVVVVVVVVVGKTEQKKVFGFNGIIIVYSKRL